MDTKLRVVLAQLNFTVGNFTLNTKKIIQAIKQAKEDLHAHLIVFPESTITAYPPEDLLLRQQFILDAEKTLLEIQKQVDGIDVVLGLPENSHGKLVNNAVWIRNKKVLKRYTKQKLPNHAVFDEQRYFYPGDKAALVSLKGIRFAIAICEDIWHTDIAQQAKDAGAEFILTLNASPYSYQKLDRRYAQLKHVVNKTNIPIFYVNMVGGQDELIFDGQSFLMNESGQIVAQAKRFEEDLLAVDINKNKQIIPSAPMTIESKMPDIYQALTLAVHDYVHKSHFSKVHIGLSGGIDSAVTLAIAADALGPENVTAVIMPSEFTAQMSVDDAVALANALKVTYQVIPITNIYKTTLESLHPVFANLEKDVTEENLQARIRSNLLMALSNKMGSLVLTTSNKSELAVGYSTLYGDMAGAFCVLKDVYKTWVYALARYRNTIEQIIPERSIDRPPSAELAPNQTDQDSLPPYEVLDQILELLIEKNKGYDEIVQQGFPKQTVKQIIQMVQRNEYKRHQAPPGPRVTERAFGKDWRYPIVDDYFIL